MEIPSSDAVLRGSETFERNEPRDAMYKVATFLVDHFWGCPAKMADGLGVLLLTWNHAHYRYGAFNFGSLENCITQNMVKLEGYRVRDILTYAPDDKPEIVALFGELMLALEIAEGRSQGRKSPVAVAKALHLLAPGFFPIWDKRIALAYRCDYSNLPTEHYIRFMEICQNLAQKLQMVVRPAPGKTCLKVIDEYNYSRFTKGWVS
jgi:hypothetical protein